MSKAVLVLDMPEGCNDCVLNNCHFCDVTNENIESYMYDITEVDKPDWCPLKELPDERPNEVYSFSIFEYEHKAFDNGWNSLRKKILGEDEENI